MPLNVGLLFNLGKHDPPAEDEPPDAHAELDAEGTVLAVAEALRSGGYRVRLIEGDEGCYTRLRRAKLDVAFNMCEGIRGAAREAQVPAMLEMLGIPYTGSGPLSLAIALDKPTTKKVLSYHGVPTPRFRSIPPDAGGNPSGWVAGLRYPLFVKPAHEGSSMGVGPESIVSDPDELAARVQHVHRWYRQDALVEEYIAGREFTVGLLGNDRPAALPVMEINFAAVPEAHGRVYSYQFKRDWDADRYYLCPAPVDEDLRERLVRAALAAYRAIDCLDVARVDLRLDDAGEPHVLEINPIPGLTPNFSDLPRMAAVARMSYEALICGILEHALRRYGLRRSGRPGFGDGADEQASAMLRTGERRRGAAPRG